MVKILGFYCCGLGSVSQSCLTLCDPMNRSTPGLPVPHHLPEFTQTHVYRVSDAIQPSHPLSSRFLLPPIPPSIRVFSNKSTLCMRWPKQWSFSLSINPSNEQPYLSIISLNGNVLNSPNKSHRQNICLSIAVLQAGSSVPSF